MLNWSSNGRVSRFCRHNPIDLSSASSQTLRALYAGPISVSCFWLHSSLLVSRPSVVRSAILRLRRSDGLQCGSRLHLSIGSAWCTGRPCVAFGSHPPVSKIIILATEPSIARLLVRRSFTTNGLVCGIRHFWPLILAKLL